MILKKINLEYSNNALIKYFSSIAHLPWSVVLSSGGANHINSRFDIITADPLITLITDKKKTTIFKNNKNYYITNDPLFILQKELNKLINYIKFTNHKDLPFIGGAIGLFSYDLAHHFEKLPKKNQSDLKIPNMIVGIYDWALIIDNYLKKITLLSYNNPDFRYKWLIKQKEINSIKFRFTSHWHSNISYQEYVNKFKKIKNYIYEGECYQINLGQRFQASYYGNEWQAFNLLNKINQAPFSAYLRFPKNTILSFSPERFISLQDGIIQTRPIKGTIPRLNDKIKDILQIKKLSQSLKEHSENLMIVDLLRNDIGKVAKIGSVSVPELFITESFTSVHHLVSTIQAYINPKFKGTDIIRACFPGGSITGVPKIRAMEIIDNLEPHCRHAWCGSIGYLSFCGRMDTNINIRSLIAEKQQLYCSAGGAIIADSNMELEYEEILNKIKPILSFLGNRLVS